jgi:hypothetical protein
MKPLLRCMSLEVALLRRADCVEQCPSLRAKRKTYARNEFFLTLTRTDIRAGYQGLRNAAKHCLFVGRAMQAGRSVNS